MCVCVCLCVYVYACVCVGVCGCVWVCVDVYVYIAWPTNEARDIWMSDILMSSVTQRDIWALHLSMTHLSHICVCDTSMSHSVASKRVTPRIKKSRHIVSHIDERVAHQRTSRSNEWRDVFPMWHDSFIQVTWLIHARDITCTTWRVTHQRTM